MPGAVIGERCSFGQNCVISSGVTVGTNVKVQNNVSIYEGTVIEDDVFLGPSCVLTNVTNPRSQVLRRALYEKTLLRRGCSIGPTPLWFAVLPLVAMPLSEPVQSWPRMFLTMP